MPLHAGVWQCPKSYVVSGSPGDGLHLCYHEFILGVYMNGFSLSCLDADNWTWAVSLLLDAG